mgnify:CR=1 FL=1
MPEFKASLLNPVLVPPSFDPVKSADCKTVTFQDYSNYLTSTESGHLNANFTDYRKVTITHHAGNIFTFSSLTGGDELIDAGDSGNNTFVYTLQDGDGVYTVELCSVPTWNIAATYQVSDDFVFFDDKFYKALTTTIGDQPDTSPTDWEEVEEGDLPNKYCDTNYFLILCDSETCKCKLIEKAACEIERDFSNDSDLCKNKCLLNTVKSLILLKSAQASFDNLDLDKAALDVDLLKRVCLCIDCSGCVGCK